MSGRRRWMYQVAAALLLVAAAPALAATTQPAAFSTTARPEIAGLPPAPLVPKTPADLRAIQTRVEAVVKEALPATVAILLDDAQGSGVIVSKDGYVLTAGHVSGTPGQRMEIVLANGERLRAKALGANNNIDSGMVKILDPAPAGGFPFVPLGSDKELQAGEWLVALGHPGGYHIGRPPVVRLGRVLVANRVMIGSDCPLINGDSGGPVLDLDGRLVGINSRIGATPTANIHVPIDTFADTWDRLAKGQEWGGAKGLLAGLGGGDGSMLPEGVELGIRAKPDARGALVNKVKRGTPAEAAGLRVGDVVVRFEGMAVKGPDDLADDVNRHAPGDTVTMKVLRAGGPVELTVKLGALH